MKDTILLHSGTVKSRPPRIVMFRILALETSELTGSVAAAADGKVLAELQLDPQQRSAQSLAPAIRSLLEQVGWQPSRNSTAGGDGGPGSFTGLRVGVATAKVFAYAAGAEVLGIGTLEAIAAAAPEGVAAVSVAVDAQRGDVVAQPFRRASDRLAGSDGRCGARAAGRMARRACRPVLPFPARC